MTTERLRPRGDQGFTLIEVLIAMLILAVGLLGLEALGIGAARSVNRAARQNDFTLVATDTLERVLNHIRRGDAVSSGSFVTSPSKDTVRLTVSPSPSPTSGGKAVTVAVTVVPNPATRILRRADSLRVTGSAYVP